MCNFSQTWKRLNPALPSGFHGVRGSMSEVVMNLNHRDLFHCETWREFKQEPGSKQCQRSAQRPKGHVTELLYYKTVTATLIQFEIHSVLTHTADVCLYSYTSRSVRLHLWCVPFEDGSRHFRVPSGHSRLERRLKLVFKLGRSDQPRPLNPNGCFTNQQLWVL